MRIDRIKFAKAAVQAGNLDTVQIAEKSGLSRNTISVIRAGKSAKPETLVRIAMALGVDVNDILED